MYHFLRMGICIVNVSIFKNGYKYLNLETDAPLYILLKI